MNGGGQRGLEPRTKDRGVVGTTLSNEVFSFGLCCVNASIDYSDTRYYIETHASTQHTTFNPNPSHSRYTRESLHWSQQSLDGVRHHTAYTSAEGGAASTEPECE